MAKNIQKPKQPDPGTIFRPELLHETVYIAPTAVVVGDVVIGENSSVWFQAVLRGDCEQIKIGVGTNIQDGSVIHADEGLPCILGDRVTVGHAAVVHGAVIADNVMIGIKAVVLNGAKIGENSIVAAGAIVTEGTEIPPNSLVMGIPGKVVRSLEEKHAARITYAAEHYIHNAKRFANSITEH